jgi:hypothetical protein
MAQLRLGLIGLGALGSRIATRLLRTGFSLEIYDIADVALRMFNMDVGGIVTGSPKMMAQPCDVILTVQPSAAEVREVAFGWEGLSRGFVRGGVLIDMGSSDPAAHGIPPHFPVHPRTSENCCLISCSDCRPSMPGMLMSDRMTLTAGSIASFSKFWWPISTAALRVLMGKKSGRRTSSRLGSRALL